MSRFTAFEAAGTWCCWENLEDAAKRARELQERENAEALAAARRNCANAVAWNLVTDGDGNEHWELRRDDVKDEWGDDALAD